MSLESVAMTGLTFANPGLAAALSVAQGIAAIQNARFQADLVTKQDEENRRQASFALQNLEIEAEKERLNKAIAKRKQLRESRKVIGETIASEAASGVIIEGDTFEIQSLKNLSENLNMLFLEQSLVTERLKGQGAEIKAKTLFDTRMAKATKDMVLRQGYLQAAGSAVSAYGIGSDAGFFDKLDFRTTMQKQLDIMDEVGILGADDRVIK